MREKWILLVSFLCLAVMVSSPANAVWNANFVHGPGFGEDSGPSSLARDSLGNAHISYYDQTSNILRYCYWTGFSWVYDTVDASANVGKFNSLALDNMGNPHVSYFSGVLSGDLKYAVRVGGVWNITVVDTFNVTEDYTSIVLDPITNYPHISYRGLNNNLRHAWLTGVSWQTETVDPNPWTGIESSITLDPSGNPCISYRTGAAMLKYAYFNGSWQIEDVGNNARYTSLSIHSNGVAHIAYKEITGMTTGVLRYARRSAPNTWVTEVVPYSTSNYGSFPSIDLDLSGNPRISFYNDIGFNLLYASKNGSWDIDTVDVTGNVGQYNSLALWNGAIPCISYYDLTADYLKLACQMLLDVGVDSILAPPDQVPPGSNAVQVRVENFGNLPSPSGICIVTITPAYAETVTVPALNPGEFTDLTTFPNWIENNMDTFNMCATTEVSGDEYSLNNSLCKDIVVFIAMHDGRVNNILSPPATVWGDSTYPVQVEVENVGNVGEIFDVRCWDLGIYLQTLTCTLNVGSSTTLNFPDWTAPNLQTTWQMCCSTRVVSDTNPANDRFCKDIQVLTGIEEFPGDPSVPKFFSLSQNSPNPVTHATTISYAIPGIRRSGDQEISGGGNLPVKLSIYDITGSLVKTLVDGEQEPGYYSVLWDGKREDGASVPTGIYFYRLQISQTPFNKGGKGDFTATRKLILLR